MKKLYFGGDILTMASKTEFPEAVVTENGIIQFTGTYQDAKAICMNDCEEIDLKGSTLMPSFVDPHSHFAQTAQGIRMCDLSETNNFGEIEACLKAYLEDNGITSEGMIFGNGYDHNFLEEECHPGKEILDRVSGEIPIYISHISGHMGVANSALLKLAGITDKSPDPPGGKFGRNADGSLNGYVEETPALGMLLAAVAPRMKMDMQAQLAQTQQLYLSYGVTTAQEGAAMADMTVGMLLAFGMSGQLKMDLVVYPMEECYRKSAETYPDCVQKYSHHVKIAGSKVILDGSPQGKSAWLSRPYENEESYCGYPTHDDAYVAEAVRRAIEGGYQILAHCNGDAASEQFLSCYEKAYSEAGRPDQDLRPVMIHCQTVREDQLDRMAECRMIPSIFIGHTYYWGDVHLKNLGTERGSRISPVRSAMERGLVYNFHQDTPVTKPDMLHSVWCAVNRRTRKGKSIGTEQCIDVYDALKAVTINAAYEYHEENSKGTLEMGKAADMVILDQNPLKAEPLNLREIKVLRTIKDGVTVYERQ